jgi:hypothetical protein
VKPFRASTDDDRLRFFTVYETAGFVGMSKPSADTVPQPAHTEEKKDVGQEGVEPSKSGLAGRGVPRRNVVFSNVPDVTAPTSRPSTRTDAAWPYQH